MRLYNIYFSCKCAYDGMKNLEVEKRNDGAYSLRNWIPCKQSLESLMNIDFISSDVERAYKTISPFDRKDVTPDIAPKTKDEFMAGYKVVMNKLEAVISLYESMRDGESKPGVDIKIPKCMDLKEYISILRDIDFILYQCPYMSSKEEELRYSGTDVGSEWITFALISAGAGTTFYILNNLAALVNKAIGLKTNNNFFKMEEEILNTMKQKNEVAAETLDVFKKIKEITYKNCVEELENEIGELKDGEERDKVSRTLEIMGNLIEKGVEIYTSIETPKEIKVLFPFSDSQAEIPESLVKYLEDKSNDKGDF